MIKEPLNYNQVLDREGIASAVAAALNDFQTKKMDLTIVDQTSVGPICIRPDGAPKISKTPSFGGSCFILAKPVTVEGLTVFKPLVIDV